MYIISSGRMIFGAAKPTPVDLRNTRNPRLANLVVSAAGPVSNFFLAALAIAALLVVKKISPGSIVELAYAIQRIRLAPGAMAPVVYILFNFAMVNVALGVFNLIPIPPLDGSGVVISLFSGSVARAYASLARYGFLILIALLYLGVLNWIFGPIFQALQMIIFGGL
jgi:Zn-dependent protease